MAHFLDRRDTPGIFGFTQGDLTANEAGKLTVGQRNITIVKALIQLLVIFPVGGFLVALILVWSARAINLDWYAALESALPASMRPYTTLLIIAVISVILIVLWGGRWFAAILDARRGQVASVSGKAAFVKGAAVNPLVNPFNTWRGKRGLRYQVRVNDVYFWVNLRQYQRLFELKPNLTFYYLPTSRMLLSLVENVAEPIKTPAQPEATPPTPYRLSPVMQRYVRCLELFLSRTDQTELRERVLTHPIREGAVHDLLVRDIEAAMSVVPDSRNCFADVDRRELNPFMLSIIHELQRRAG